MSTGVEGNRGDINFSEISLEENAKHVALDAGGKKRPKRVLHFSDGILEEYSSDDEVAVVDVADGQVCNVDPKSLDWTAWFWYRTYQAGSKTLQACDYMGESLANFFGITSPKYQFEINEYHRMQAEEEEMKRKEDLEMGGWTETNRKNLINLNNNPEDINKVDGNHRF